VQRKTEAENKSLDLTSASYTLKSKIDKLKQEINSSKKEIDKLSDKVKDLKKKRDDEATIKEKFDEKQKDCVIMLNQFQTRLQVINEQRAN